MFIGNTPLLETVKFAAKNNLKSNIFAKLEYLNPGGSVKDRLSLAMVSDAEEKGLINKETVLIEPTSGNTGIGLALISAARGYKLILTMPETMSIERRKLISAYGAKIILTEGSKGMKGAIKKAEELASEIKNSFIPSQFANPANPLMHYKTTGPEIWDDLNGNVDIFIAGVGTGGTISGVGKFLKEKNPNIKIIAVEPANSPVLSQGIAGLHKIQGIGAGFVPDTLNTKIYDEIITITDEDAINTSRNIAKIEGLLVGISSGAALCAATKIAKKEKEKNIVVILPDSGERYLSTELYGD